MAVSTQKCSELQQDQLLQAITDELCDQLPGAAAI
jgi:hypothetical protein